MEPKMPYGITCRSRPNRNNKQASKETMENLLDVKLTNQERQHIILKSVDKDYRQRIEEEQQKYPDARCFFSYWKINGNDLLKLNRSSSDIKSWFDLEEEEIIKFDPRFNFVLLEGERVEAGEWDKTYGCWAKHSYQRVFVLAMNTIVERLEEDGVMVQELSFANDPNKEHYPLLFPYTWEKDFTLMPPAPLGLLDIPMGLLEEHEEKRTYQKLFFANEFYSTFKKYVVEDKEEYDKKQAKRTSYKNSKRKHSSFKKAFKGGFSNET
jgi:hypothetical protein